MAYAKATRQNFFCWKVDMILRHAFNILVTTIILMAVFCQYAEAENDKKVATIVLDVSRLTQYTIQEGASNGELVLDLKAAYPEDIVKQLDSQKNNNFTNFDVLERSPLHIKFNLYILPVGFKFTHSRQMNPQQILINIFAPTPKKGGNLVPEIPPLPFWEMLTEGSVILPESDFRRIEGTSLAHESYFNAVRLYEIGTYDAALIRIRKNLKDMDSKLWTENLILLAEVLFKKAKFENLSMTEARKALLVASEETEDPYWKSRMLLMMSYASYFEGLMVDADKTFKQGIAQFPELKDYFLLGLLQIALKDYDKNSIETINKELLKSKKLGEEAKRKVCFSDVLMQVVKGDVFKANKSVDNCLKQIDPTIPLSANQSLIAAEARLLSYRYSEAKQILGRIERDYPDFPQISLVGLRFADILCYEHKYEECSNNYKEVARRWPKTRFARIADLRGRELESHRTGKGNPIKMYLELNLHQEPEPVPREVKLSLLWNYESIDRNDMAYLYLVEIIRRYNGDRYWPFAAGRFTKVVLNAYKDLEANGDYLSMINLYQANTPFPLGHETLDEIAKMVAHAYLITGRIDGGIQVFLDALNRKNRPVEGERELIMGLTEAYLEKGDYFRASKTQDYFRSRFKTPEDNRDYYFMLGEIEQSQGNMDAALDAFSKAMALADNSTEKRSLGLKIGRVFYFQEKYQNAVDAYQPALAYFLDDSLIIDRNVIPLKVVNSMYFLADSQLQLGRYEDSLKTYNRILKLFPNDSRREIAIYMMAKCLYNLGKIQQAVAMYEYLAKSENDFWKDVGTLKTTIAQWQVLHDLGSLMQ